jgi:hypothetical protein
MTVEGRVISGHGSRSQSRNEGVLATGWRSASPTGPWFGAASRSPSTRRLALSPKRCEDRGSVSRRALSPRSGTHTSPLPDDPGMLSFFLEGSATWPGAACQPLVGTGSQPSPRPRPYQAYPARHDVHLTRFRVVDSPAEPSFKPAPPLESSRLRLSQGQQSMFEVPSTLGEVKPLELEGPPPPRPRRRSARGGGGDDAKEFSGAGPVV